jgi:hypothetical protein
MQKNYKTNTPILPPLPREQQQQLTSKLINHLYPLRLYVSLTPSKNESINYRTLQPSLFSMLCPSSSIPTSPRNSQPIALHARES